MEKHVFLLLLWNGIRHMCLKPRKTRIFCYIYQRVSPKCGQIHRKTRVFCYVYQGCHPNVVKTIEKHVFLATFIKGVAQMWLNPTKTRVF